MTTPAFEIETVDPESLKRVMVLIGGSLLALAVMFYFFRPNLLSFWDGFYGSWRDYFLRERIKNTPLFFLLIGAAIFISSFLISARKSRPDSTLSLARLSILIVFIVIPLLGLDISISIKEWRHFGSPCYDGYCQRASLWTNFVLHPSVSSRQIFYDSLLESYVGSSWIPPILIGSLSAIGLPIVYSFMLLNLACWLGCVGILLSIAKRYYAFDRLALIVLFIVFFGHLGVARSLLFPQTDPLSVFFITLTAACLIELNNNPSLRLYILTITIMTFGFFVKLSFLPAFTFPFFIHVFSPQSKVSTRLNNLAGIIVLTTLPLCLATSILFLSGLDGSFFHMLKVGNMSNYIGGDFFKDNNPLRFFIVAIQFVQFFPLILVCSKPWWKYLWHYRLLLSIVLIFPVSCLFLHTPFWMRYSLPSLPFFALVVTPGLLGSLGKGRNLVVILNLYVIGNATFLLCKLYY
jgi:hypothetical protein